MTVRPRIVGAIWKKELSETLRDRRTVFVMIVLPILLYPLLIMVFTRVAESESEAALAAPSRVAIWGAVPEDLDRELASRPRFTLHPGLGLPDSLRAELAAGRLQRPAERPVEPRDGRSRDPDVVPHTEDEPNPVLDAARQLVATRRVDAVLVVWAAGGASSIYFDSVREESELARTRLRRALDAHRDRLAQTPFDIATRDIAPARRQAGRVIGALLPFMLLSLCIMGGLYPAIDMTAGEKERGTMQTLMCAPVLPAELIGGKFLAVWVLSLASAVANVASLGVTVTRVLPLDGASIPPATYVVTGFILLPVTLFTSALFLALAVFARDYKEGQSFLTPVYFVLAFPAMATILPTIELNAWTTFVPVVNIALLIKSLLVAEARPDLVFLTLASSAIYAALALALAVRVFHREQVLLGGRESMRDLFGLERGTMRMPPPSFALVMYCVVLVASFYGSLLLESRGLIATLLVTQWGFFLLPVLGAALLLRMDVRETFALRVPPPLALIAAAVLGLTAWTFASGVLLRIAPPPDTLVRALERLVRLDETGAPWWAVWLAVAVTPAICEEALFRGFILNGLRPLGAVPAIAISALLFGIAHASIYRLLPTLFLGLLLGILVWRTGSLLVAVVMHAVNNALLASLSESPRLAHLVGVELGAEALPWTPTLVGTAVAAISLGSVFAMSGGGMGHVRKRTDDAPGQAGAASVSH